MWCNKIFQNVSRYKTITTGRYAAACVGGRKLRRTRFLWDGWKFFASAKTEAGYWKEPFLMKKYILIAGVNGAGKSTLYQTLESLKNPLIKKQHCAEHVIFFTLCLHTSSQCPESSFLWCFFKWGFCSSPISCMSLKDSFMQKWSPRKKLFIVQKGEGLQLSPRIDINYHSFPQKCIWFPKKEKYNKLCYNYWNYCGVFCFDSEVKSLLPLWKWLKWKWHLLLQNVVNVTFPIL